MALKNFPEELNPPPRLIMGPGPLMADPRVLRAMSMPLLGQFDPAFLTYMAETQALFREVFETKNQQTFVVNGTARAATEAILVSIIDHGDKVLVPIFGRFGHLLAEIAERAGGDVATMERPWGEVFAPEEIEGALAKWKPKVVAIVHGDTSTTMAQPLDEIGSLCRKHGAILYVDACATVGGMEIKTDAWKIDSISGGLQKCLSGPPGAAPTSFNERVVKIVRHRHHVEKGLEPPGFEPGKGSKILSNYFDLSMLMDYWGEGHLPHHTEAISMLYAARECARIFVKDGHAPIFERHRLGSRALCAGLVAMGLELYGNQRTKMPNVTGVLIPEGVNGDEVRKALLHEFGIEIGTSFGPLHGKIWRIGTMGYTCRKENILICLGALEATLLKMGHKLPAGQAVQAAMAEFDAAKAKAD
ncbi:MAG: alanine--glyoxylate aminotransferase family protein [Hyphomicrobiaceae bacterium]